LFLCHRPWRYWRAAAFFGGRCRFAVKRATSRAIEAAVQEIDDHVTRFWVLVRRQGAHFGFQSIVAARLGGVQLAII
jgi:hypothetical protein